MTYSRGSCLGNPSIGNGTELERDHGGTTRGETATIPLGLDDGKGDPQHETFIGAVEPAVSRAGEAADCKSCVPYSPKGATHLVVPPFAGSTRLKWNKLW